MSCCHKHQQQRYHNENTKIYLFMHYMYVHILFPLTKTIPIMFERVTTHYQTLQRQIGHNARPHHNLNASPRYHTLYHACSLSLTGISHNATRYHNFNTLPHALPYIFSQFRMVWGLFTMGSHALPSNLQKICILNFFIKN